MEEWCEERFRMRERDTDMWREVRAGTTRRFAFDIDAESRDMLLEGLDAIDLTLKSRKEIAAFVERDRVARPWIYSGAVVE